MKATYNVRCICWSVHVKGVAELQKAQRMCRQVSGWDKDLKGLTRVTQVTLDYCKGIVILWV